MQENDSTPKKDGGKPSLADRLRQLADGTLPLEDRSDRIPPARNRPDRDRSDRNFEDSRSSRAEPLSSLMDLPKFSLPQERGDFPARPPDFRNPQDPREYQQQRERQSFGRGHRGAQMHEEYMDVPRIQGGIYQEEFENRIHGQQRIEEFGRLGPPSREQR